MYADDTTFISTLQNFTSNHSNNSSSYNVSAELTKITQWLAVNRLSLNAKKTKMMIFHSKQNKLSINEIPIIKINDMPIERVTEFKFLGVLIDSNLTWSPNCNYIANKLSRMFGVVSRLKHYVPTHILTIIYNSLFLSHISYGITYWGFNIYYSNIAKDHSLGWHFIYRLEYHAKTKHGMYSRTCLFPEFHCCIEYLAIFNKLSVVKELEPQN